MKVGVVGSRESNESQKQVLFILLTKIISDVKDVKLVSGGCYKGADKWAEEFAAENLLEMKVHKPEKMNAFYFRQRNLAITDDSDIVIATMPKNPDYRRFAGTEQTVRCALYRKIPVILIHDDCEIRYYNSRNIEDAMRKHE